ncbi:hypothetical protein E0K50_19710 [Escherichia coli]|nr:hypothetical protein E0K50_19710 [Escherichia coli]TZC31400.1 hypothetical protein E0J34_22510 [Escherichia coli]
MMITGNGINTVTVNGKVKHITELDYITLCLEWTKLREENNRLYEINNQANRGWRGFIRKRTARAVLTGMCYSAGSAMRHGSSSLTRLTGQSAMMPSTWRR